MNVDRLCNHESVTALAYAVGALRRQADKAEDDLEAAMLSRASAVSLYLLREITNEWSAKNAL